MFRDNGKCSLRRSWDACWKDECTNLLRQEWGCALRESSCTTPYHKTLHQVRKPLETVASLVTKFCIGDLGSGSLQPSFLVFAGALFPRHDFSTMSCIEAAGYYLYEYNTALFEAARKGHIDGVFAVEDATPCSIAGLAGFYGESNNHHDDNDGESPDEPHGGNYQQLIRDRLHNICDSGGADGGDGGTNHQPGTGGRRNEYKHGGNDANRPMTSTENSYNKGNRKLSLDWDDLLGGRHGSKKKEGDRDLHQKLKKMTKKLGYDERPEQNEF